MDIFKIPALLRAKKKITSLKDGDFFTISTKTNDLDVYDNRIISKKDLFTLISANVPYKEYVAILTQSGTSAPVATELINTLGSSIAFSRTATGSYKGTATGLFTVGKTVVQGPTTWNDILTASGGPPPITPINIFSSGSQDVNSIYIYNTVVNIGNGTATPTDGLLNGAGYSWIRILVYN